MQQKHWKIEFSQQNKKADKELTRERIALRKFQRSIQSVQKCKTAEVEAESLLAEQLSLYIGTRGKFSEFTVDFESLLGKETTVSNHLIHLLYLFRKMIQEIRVMKRCLEPNN